MALGQPGHSHSERWGYSGGVACFSLPSCQAAVCQLSVTMGRFVCTVGGKAVWGLLSLDLECP